MPDSILRIRHLSGLGQLHVILVYHVQASENPSTFTMHHHLTLTTESQKRSEEDKGLSTTPVQSFR